MPPPHLRQRWPARPAGAGSGGSYPQEAATLIDGEETGYVTPHVFTGPAPAPCEVRLPGIPWYADTDPKPAMVVAGSPENLFFLLPGDESTGPRVPEFRSGFVPVLCTAGAPAAVMFIQLKKGS